MWRFEWALATFSRGGRWISTPIEGGALSPANSLSSLSHDRLKSKVLSALKASSSGVMSRTRIASAIRQEYGADALTRLEAQHFLARVNRAIGALQLESKPKIRPLRSDSSKLKLLRHKKRSDEVTRKALMLAVRERVVLVQFRCADCDALIELRTFDTNPQCTVCGTYAVPR